MVPSVQLPTKFGVRQGNPLSPALFAMVCFVLVPALQRLSPDIKILVFTDDPNH